MDQILFNMNQHYIICGFGRIGMDVSQNLIASGVPVVIIDLLPPTKEGILDKRTPYLIGDASHDEILVKAGIERGLARIG